MSEPVNPYVDDIDEGTIEAWEAERDGILDRITEDGTLPPVLLGPAMDTLAWFGERLPRAHAIRIGLSYVRVLAERGQQMFGLIVSRSLFDPAEGDPDGEPLACPCGGETEPVRARPGWRGRDTIVGRCGSCGGMVAVYPEPV